MKKKKQVQVEHKIFVKDNEGDCGKCSACGSGAIDYGGCEFEGNQMFYEVTCLDCKAVGKEWYVVKYIETMMERS